MHPYSARDVERLVRLPRNRIRSLVEAGFVSPARGPRNSWRFSFQDLILLRTAQALAAANVPHHRIVRSVKELRRRLPESMPLTGLNISAEADRVVVREGARRWRAESGQYLLGFEGDPDRGSLNVLEPPEPESAEARPAPAAETWFHRAEVLEAKEPDTAVEAYRRSIELNPALLKARINLGCLLHEIGRLDEAEAVYRDALRQDGKDPVLLYDFGILLEDRGRKNEAIDIYRAALREDPGFADCHYNLALLCERLGRRKDAIQHLAAYRRLNAPRTSE